MRPIVLGAALLLVAVAARARAQAAAPATPDSARAAPPPAPPSAAPPAAIPDPWFGADKVRHLVLAGMIQGGTFGLATAAGMRERPALLTASATTAIVSLGKEIADRRRGGRFSVRDLAWDAAGAALWGVLVARSGR